MVPKSQHESKSFSGDPLPAFPERHPSRSGRGSGAPRLLIVDDDQGILNLVAKMVTRLGYHATTTADAADALLCLADTRYDMVISDYAMPRMDGYQLADQIREKHFGTKIIIMTGHRDPDLIDLLQHSGIVDGLLFKPFTLDTLKEKLQLAEDSHFHRVERTSGSFCRRLELPAEVNPKTIDATYKKGVLKLVFKKTKAF